MLYSVSEIRAAHVAPGRLMAGWSTTRMMAVLAATFAGIAVALLASVWLGISYPHGASCYTDAGYAAIKANAQANESLAIFALALTAVSVLICAVGVVRATGHRAAFALSLVPLILVGLAGLFTLFVSAFYCQN